MEDKNINILSNMEEKDDVLARSYNDLLYFGRAFLPADFLNKSSSPIFHKEVGKKLIDTSPGARICNILPRGFGKSILSKAAILHKICFAYQVKLSILDCWQHAKQSFLFLKINLQINRC